MNGSNDRQTALCWSPLDCCSAGLIGGLGGRLVRPDTAAWPLRLALSRRRADGRWRSSGLLSAAAQRRLPASSGGIFEALCRARLPRPLQRRRLRRLAAACRPTTRWRGCRRPVRTTMLAALPPAVQELEHDADRARRSAAAGPPPQAEQIQAILSGLADPILAVDDYDEVVLANRSAEELFDFDADEPENRAAGPSWCTAEKLVELLTADPQRKTAGSRTDEIEIVDADGQSRWYRATAAKLAAARTRRRDGRPPAGAVAVLRDIGDQKALQKRNAEFVSSVSHEMKTPLAGIKAYVELLVDGDAEDEETREEFLDVINGQADRLQRLVDNLLNLARIEAGVVNVEQAEPLAQRTAGRGRRTSSSRRPRPSSIELVADLSPMYLGVLADRDMLLQAAINLLSNAIKYTPEGGRVTLRSRLADDQVRVRGRRHRRGPERRGLPAGVREVLPRQEGQEHGRRHRAGAAAGQAHRRRRPRRTPRRSKARWAQGSTFASPCPAPDK